MTFNCAASSPHWYGVLLHGPAKPVVGVTFDEGGAVVLMASMGSTLVGPGTTIDTVIVAQPPPLHCGLVSPGKPQHRSTFVMPACCTANVSGWKAAMATVLFRTQCFEARHDWLTVVKQVSLD